MLDSAPLSASNPVPSGCELRVPDGLELPGASVFLHLGATATKLYRLRVEAEVRGGGWKLIGELVTLLRPTVSDDGALVAVAGVPGATGWRVQAWPQTVDFASTETGRVVLSAGECCGAKGLEPVPRRAELVGERARVASGVLAPSGSDALVIPAGGRLVAFTMWSSGVGNATVTLGTMAALTCPQDGAISGRPNLPGSFTATFATPAGVTGGWFAEYVE